MEIGNLPVMGQKQPCHLRAGQSKGVLTDIFKFLNMPWIHPAGSTQVLRTYITVDVAQSLFI